MKRWGQMAAVLLGLAALAGAAEARIVRVQIDRVEPFAGGMEFGATGSYVRIIGVASGELDPREAGNRVIVNLDRAPRNARGLVEYQVDFYVMRPTDPARGNRKILYEVVNRGRKFLLPWFHEALDSPPGAVNDPAKSGEAGNGFAFREGYTIVWSGWDPDAPRANHGMSIRVPVATAGGAPIVKVIRDEAGRKVFDGVLAHIAGIGKVFANEAWGQPNRTNTQHEDHLFPENRFPFAHATLTDPVTGTRGALLRGDGFDPLVMEVNTSTEYWQKGASLLHTDPLGARDLLNARLLLPDDAARYVDEAARKDPLKP